MRFLIFRIPKLSFIPNGTAVRTLSKTR